jgi:hypothetical protein
VEIQGVKMLTSFGFGLLNLIDVLAGVGHTDQLFLLGQSE